MVCPDGGIGRPHNHPFWGKCPTCAAASQGEQLLVLLLLNPVTISLALLLLMAWLT